MKKDQATLAATHGDPHIDPHIELNIGPDTVTLIESLAKKLKSRALTMCTAESCTGGLVGALCTSRPGSSEWFYGGVIAYDNSLKMNILGVAASTLQAHGAVSPQTAESMALGAQRACGADCALALTGVAGPDGGSAEKPVGLVVIGLALPGGVARTHSAIYPGNRDEIRSGAARKALQLLNEALEQPA